MKRIGLFLTYIVFFIVAAMFELIRLFGIFLKLIFKKYPFNSFVSEYDFCLGDWWDNRHKFLF